MVNLDDLAGAGAQRLHNRNRVQSLGKVGSHGHRHANCSQDERNKAHQRKQARGLIKTGSERGVGLAVIRDLRLRQQFQQSGLKVGNSFVGDCRAIRGWRNLE